MTDTIRSSADAKLARVKQGLAAALLKSPGNPILRDMEWLLLALEEDRAELAALRVALARQSEPSA